MLPLSWHFLTPQQPLMVHVCCGLTPAKHEHVSILIAMLTLAQSTTATALTEPSEWLQTVSL